MALRSGPLQLDAGSFDVQRPRRVDGRTNTGRLPVLRRSQEQLFCRAPSGSARRRQTRTSPEVNQPCAFARCTPLPRGDKELSMKPATLFVCFCLCVLLAERGVAQENSRPEEDSHIEK